MNKKDLKYSNLTTSKFYQDIVGLNISKRFNASPGVEIAFLGDGETKIELICNKALKEYSQIKKEVLS